MEIYGKSYDFLFSVGAEQEIARLCPDGDLKNLRAVMTGTSDEAMEKAKEMLCILSRWAEKARAFLDPDHEPAPLTQELLDLLTVRQFQQLQAEAMAAIVRDQKPSVEVDPAKKNGDPKSN